MDPLTVFPPEIIHQIWRHLEPADLLAARAVAPHWLASISDCPGAWVTDFSHDWTEFLAVKKAVRSWSSKNIRRQTVRNVRACVFRETTFYLLFDDESLIMFDHFGRAIRKFKGRVYSVYSGQGGLIISVRPKMDSSNFKMSAHLTENRQENETVRKTDYCWQSDTILELPSSNTVIKQLKIKSNDATKGQKEKRKTHVKYKRNDRSKYKSSLQISSYDNNLQNKVYETQNVCIVNAESGTKFAPHPNSMEILKTDDDQNTAVISPLTSQQSRCDNKHTTAQNKPSVHIKCESESIAMSLGRPTTAIRDQTTERTKPNSPPPSQQNPQNSTEPYKQPDNCSTSLNQELSNSNLPVDSHMNRRTKEISSYDKRGREKPLAYPKCVSDPTNMNLGRTATCTNDQMTTRTKSNSPHTVQQNPESNVTHNEHERSIFGLGLDANISTTEQSGPLTKQSDQNKPNKTSSNKSSEQSKNPQFVTYFTDFLMNVTDEFPDTTILSAFQNGFLYIQNGDTFININKTKLRCERSEFDLRPNQIAICTEFVLTVCGLIDKKVCNYDFELLRQLSTLMDYKPHILQSFKASPMAIPYVVISGERDPYVCIKAEIGHFTKVFVYSNRELIFENIFETHQGTSYFFTNDFFVIAGSTVTVYPLMNFQENWTLDRDLSNSRITGKGLLFPLIPNCFAAFDRTKNNLEFYFIDGEKQSISKMGALEEIVQIEECFASYGYCVDSENGVHLYHFAPD